MSELETVLEDGAGQEQGDVPRGEEARGRREAITPCSRPASLATLSLCGVPVRADNVRTLASKLDGDQLAQKLERAVENDNTIVALSREERQRIIDVLGGSPHSLPDLRSTLTLQLKRLNDRERQQRHEDFNRVASRQHERPA